MNLKVLSQPTVLETERMVLYPLERSHFNLVMQVMADREIRDGMLMPAHDTPEKQENWWARFEEARELGQAVQWAAFLKASQTYVALMTVKEIDHGSHRGELGYSLMKEFWGRGLGTEAARCVMEFMFDEVNLHRLIAQVLPQNLASQAIVRKLGFELEARFHDVHFYEGRYYDLLQFYKINPHHKK